MRVSGTPLNGAGAGSSSNTKGAGRAGCAGPAGAADEPDTAIVWPQDAENAQFILREYDGCVAVFAAGDSTPITMTDIPVRDLREADRALLNAGLPAADRDEVLTLLEDLGS